MKHLRQWTKKALAYTLAITMIVPMLAGLAPIQTQAEQEPVENTMVLEENTDDFTVEGTNSIGSLLAEEISTANGAQSNGDGYSIFGITMENNVATVEYAALEDCTLLVSVYDETTGQMAGSGNVEISADYYSTKVTLEVPVMPQYFVVKAYMVDSTNMKPLRPVYENTMYTKDMQELKAATVDDFEPERVLNLDDDKTTNFMVYGEDTIRIDADGDTNVVTSQGEDSGIYTVENISDEIKDVKTGDIVTIGSDTDVTILKVKKITIEGTRATIVEDDVELEEVFECIKIESVSNSKGAVIDESTCGEGVTYLGQVEEQPQVLSAKPEIGASIYLEGTYDEFAPLVDPEGGLSLGGGAKFEIKMEKESANTGLSGSITGDVSLGITLDIKFYLTGEKQMLEFYVGATLAGNIKIEGAWEKTVKELARITIPTIPGLNVALVPKIVFKVSGSVEFAAAVSGKIGVKYDSTAQQKVEIVKEFGLDKLEASVNAAIGIGLAFEPAINIISSKLAEAGLEAEAMIEGTVSVGTNFGTDHSCITCLSANLSAKVEAEPEIKLANFKVPIEASLTVAVIDLGVCYYSFTHKDFGWGECPYAGNGIYSATIKTKNRIGKPLSGVKITITGTKTDGTTFEVTGTTNSNGVVPMSIPEGKNIRIVGSKENYKASSRTLPKWTGTQRVADLVLYEFNQVITDPVVLKEGVTVNKFAYNNAYIKKVVIEDDAYSIENSVFQGAEIEEVVINSKVTKLPSYLFYGTTIHKIKIPDNVVEIGIGTFAATKLPESFQIGEGVKKIGESAFYNVSEEINRVVIREGSCFDSWVFNGTVIKELFLENVNSVSVSLAFYGATIEKVTISKNVTKIPESIFWGSTIHEIEIPDSITEIGGSAFYRAIVKKDIKMGRNVKVYGGGAFASDSIKIDRVVVNEGYTIQDSAFSGAYIAELVLNSSEVRGWYTNKMDGAVIGKVTITNNVYQIPAYFFRGSTIYEIKIPNDLYKIDEYAFYKATLPEDFSVSDKVKVGYMAFADSTYNYIPPTGTSGMEEKGGNDAELSDVLETEWAKEKEVNMDSFNAYELPTPVYQALPTVTLRTVTLTGLRPNDTYNFYSVKANYEFMSPEEIMAPENLLYVTQVQTDEKGTVTINYLPREEYDSPMEFAKCMSREDISQAKVQQEDIIYDGTQHEILPVVVYEGQELAEYEDYDVVGDFQVTEKGRYTIYIVGKNDYCGTVKVDFRVYSADDNPFADVKESGWEYPFVKEAYDKKLMSGKSKDENGLIRFDPGNYMTRAEFVQTLYNKEGKEEVAYTSKFTDVPDGQWYTDAILWAAEKGIIAGKGEIFDVSGKITREEMATILYKYATNYKGYETAGRAEFTGYTDAATISGWATENMKWALHYGIMKGKKEALAPKDNATRAECATMLSNFMKAYE